MRALLVFLSLVAMAVPAFADTDVVLGPVRPAAPPRRSPPRRKALASLSPHPVAAACIADAACLAKAGADLGGKRVIAVSVGRGGKIARRRRRRRGQARARRARRQAEGAAGRARARSPRKRRSRRPRRCSPRATSTTASASSTRRWRATRSRTGSSRCPRSCSTSRSATASSVTTSEAIAMYQNYLVGVPDASNKDVVESLIGEAKDRQAEEDKRIAEQKKIDADLEAQRIDAEQKKAEDARKAKEAEARAAEEQRQAEVLRIRAREGDVQPPPGAQVDDRDGGARRARHRCRRRTSPSTSATRSRSSTRSSAATRRRSCRRRRLATCRSERDDGQRDATLATSFMIGGGAVLAVSAIIFAIDPGNVERPRAQVAVTPHSVGMVVHW